MVLKLWFLISLKGVQEGLAFNIKVFFSLEFGENLACKIERKTKSTIKVQYNKFIYPVFDIL